MERRKGEINEGLPIIRGEFGQTPVGPGRDSWSIFSRPVLHVTLRSHSKFEDLTSTLEEQKHMLTWHTTAPPPQEKTATMRTKSCGPERTWTDLLPAAPRMAGATLPSPPGAMGTSQTSLQDCPSVLHWVPNSISSHWHLGWCGDQFYVSFFGGGG